MFKNSLRTASASLVGCAILFLILFSVVRSNSGVQTVVSQRLSPGAPNSNKAKQGDKPTRLDDIRKEFPKVDYDAPEPEDPVQKAKRRKKGKRYDNGYLSKDPGHSRGLVTEWDLGLSAFPIAQSDVVVIAKTITREAFLSNDKTGIYTELSVEVEEALKGEHLLSGKVIDVSRLGGVVRYSTGQESFFHIAGQNMPQANRRYLFFLKSIKDSEDFQIITAYELGPSGVKALDTPNQFSQYNGTDESSFMNTVRNALLQP
ncbi:MAG: hypothetical protein AABM67_01205 [Acidobacteriota bacterium]